MKTWMLGAIITGLAGFALQSFASDCESLHRNNTERVEIIEERLSIPFSGETLHVRPSQNGGVKVVGNSTSGNWEVTVCKTLWRRGMTETPSSEITVEATPTKLVAQPYDVEGWSVFFVLRVPEHASMNASTTNGPISIRDVRGSFAVESKNGPLFLDNVNGKVVAELQNGPISFDELAGEFDLETRNGPISADFRNTDWRGAKIRATTDNGPVSLHSYASFPAGISVRSDGHGPIRCEHGCGEITRDRRGRQSPRSFRFGPATDDVVLSTNNGPLSIDVQ